jgi:hypothetical protein
VFIDLPGNATSLSVTVSEGGAAAALSFYAVRADFPAAALSPQIAAAPAPPGAASWSIGGAVSQKTVVIPASGGRWYIVATNPGASEATFTLATQVAVNTTAASPLQAGNYFNPQRGGHGIFLSQASGQQVVDWYTFLEDGTPTWYLAQNGAPAAGSGVWSSTLYRAAWDGSGGTPTPVGDVTLTATSADHAMFSWHLYGQGGSEAFELLARPECVDAGGSVNLNGEWYPPALSGIGFDALVIPGQQFDAFYLYDDGGNPRWVVGAQGPFAASATVPMLQASGFCPLCAWQALTTQAAGSLTVAYANATGGQLSAAITLQAPLSGRWSFDQPIARLTGAAGCP